MKLRFTSAVAVAAAITLAGATAAAAATGPSTTETPYLVPATDDVSFTSIITVGDEVDGYPFVGIPDGLGAYDNGDGTFTALVNHELRAELGGERAFGAPSGAFISKWTIDAADLTVKAGEDLITAANDWDFGTQTWVATTDPFSRFCSADLPPAGAFYDAATGLGTPNLIYMTGEETGAEGRATATVVTGDDAGTSYILPWLGKYSFENIVALPDTGAKTVVLALDDSGGGQVYLYVGDKRAEGNDIERAGLVGGTLYGLKIDTVPVENDDVEIPAEGVGFSFVEIPGAAEMTGAELEAASVDLGVSSLARPEDGAWDPTNVNGFYFGTTASFKGTSRLWHLEFTDVLNDPVAGGIATVPVASPAYDDTIDDAQQGGPRMIDNLTVNHLGQVYLQEDPGSSAYLSGIFRYDPATGEAERIAQHDAERFAPDAAGFLTTNEESSGIIPLPFLGTGYYLVDVQAHFKTDPATTVEGGQLLLMEVESEKTADEPGTGEPGADEPGATDPGMTQPGAGEPGTTEPGKDQPETTGTTPASADKGGDQLATTGAADFTGIAGLTAALVVAGLGLLAFARLRGDRA